MAFRINMEAKNTTLWGRTDRQTAAVLSQLPEETREGTAPGVVGGSSLHLSLTGGPCPL